MHCGQKILSPPAKEMALLRHVSTVGLSKDSGGGLGLSRAHGFFLSTESGLGLVRMRNGAGCSGIRSRGLGSLGLAM